MASPRGFERQDERAQAAPARQRPPDREPLPAETLAGMIGNRAFTQVIGRAGAGIMPDGRAHPAVEAGIATMRGSGAGLDAGVRDRFAPRLGGDLKDVRVHTDSTADALARSVSARAFVTGNDMFFAAGQYRPATPAGDSRIPAWLRGRRAGEPSGAEHEPYGPSGGAFAGAAGAEEDERSAGEAQSPGAALRALRERMERLFVPNGHSTHEEEAEPGIPAVARPRRSATAARARAGATVAARRSPVELWALRVLAIVLVAVLLVAFALILAHVA